ncbi:hypothetical protein EDB81DRAFT_778566 [Dactylonectria macrodidyma]|uniref:Uncharacterized protein n=1 Tax=Dactylonectria macrodidyma TaxID=307937 RepID=A0A9P9FTI1_9HYPO|nr:hypothetical protein EDB81DRAFT_778566 [Dactylonectria macrodidyma]
MSDLQEDQYPTEGITLSLCGDCFFYSGPAMTCGSVKDTIGISHPQEHDHGTGSNITNYVVLGPRSHYFRCTRPRGGDVAAINNSDLEDYEGLVEFLDEHDVERPEILSLGVNGHYFIRAENGEEKWDLPAKVARTLFAGSAPASSASPVDSVWLGSCDAFVAQRKDGSRIVELHGQYPGLEATLLRTSRVLAMAMNLQDGVGYAVLWDGTMQCEPGMLRMESGRALRRFCDANGVTLEGVVVGCIACPQPAGGAGTT